MPRISAIRYTKIGIGAKYRWCRKKRTPRTQKGVRVSRAETIMPRWVCAPKYRLRNCSKCLSRSEMQSRRVGFGTAARVLRTINMNYGKRSRTGPSSLFSLSPSRLSTSSLFSSPERSGSSEVHRGAHTKPHSRIRIPASPAARIYHIFFLGWWIASVASSSFCPRTLDRIQEWIAKLLSLLTMINRIGYRSRYIYIIDQKSDVNSRKIISLGLTLNIAKLI